MTEKRHKTGKILLFIAAGIILAAILAAAVIICAGESCGRIYSENYPAALADKYDRLCEGEGGRIILVGGSSLPFGIRSDIIESETGKSVTNLGVYGLMGTKAMCEIALSCAKDGDIIIIAPETESTGYSLYFDADLMWEAVDGRREIIGCFSTSERLSMWASLLSFEIRKLQDYKAGGITADGIYIRANFNEYGDLAADRPSNIMTGGYNRAATVSLEKLDNAEFVGYINVLTSELEEKGCTVYFTFPPINAPAAEFNGAQSDEFTDALASKLSCKVLGSPDQMCYDSRYFYNSNYHLNSAGAVLHTVNLLDFLKPELGIDTPTDIVIPVPGASDSETPENAGEKYAACEKYFEYSVSGGTCSLVCVLEEYRKTVTALYLPQEHDGMRVDTVMSGCFEGCTALEEIFVPDGYSLFDYACFGGCETLKRIHIYIKNPDRTAIPLTGLFEGTPAGLEVYIPAERIGNFSSDYSWRVYSDYFRSEE